MNIKHEERTARNRAFAAGGDLYLSVHLSPRAHI